MKPYSKNLRQRIINTYLEGQESIGQIAQRFQVSKSFVQKLLKQYRETVPVSPKAPRGGKASAPEKKAVAAT